MQKTRSKNVLFMTVAFVFHEKVLKCKLCRSVFTPDALARIVGTSCNFGWDVLVFVGRLYQRHRTTVHLHPVRYISAAIRAP